MGLWDSFWSRHSPDDLFSYNTFKMVIIRDRYLGVLHHGLQIGILVYIIVYVLVLEKQFLNREPAIGLVRLAVQTPPKNFRNVSTLGRHDYCVEFEAENPNNLPLCVYPPIDQVSVSTGSVLFLTTHMNVTEYYANCNVNLPSCEPTPVNGTVEYLVANLDNITISIDHSAQVDFDGKAPLGYVQMLRDPKDQVSWKRCRDCSVNKFKSLSADRLSLRDIFTAAYLDLDAEANAYLIGTDDYTGPQTYRSFGAVILLSIVYNNIQNYFSRDPPIVYYYRPQLITDVDDYALDSIYTSYPNNRTVVHRKGIRIVGIMSGEIGNFTFQALLIQLTTSIALVKIATLAVDVIAINMLPRRVMYKNAKYEKTGDMKKRRHIEMESIGSMDSIQSVNSNSSM